MRENRTGSPSAILDLTCRRFQVGGRLDHDAAEGRFLDTALRASPAALARGLGWPVAEARERLEALVLSGQAARRSGHFSSLDLP